MDLVGWYSGNKNNLKDLQDSENKWNKGIVKLSRDLGIPIIATNDAHYIKQEDAFAQDALVCISTGKTVTDTKRLRYIDAQTFYVKSPEEMKELFPIFPMHWRIQLKLRTNAMWK